MTQTPFRSRVMIDVSPELKARCDAVIPFGIRNQFYAAVLEDLVALIEEKGSVVIAVMIEHKLSLKTASRTLAKGLKNGDTRDAGKKKHKRAK